MFSRTKKSVDVESYLSGLAPGTVVTPGDIQGLIGERAESSADGGWKIVASCIRRLELHHGLVVRWDRVARHWRVLLDSEKPADMTSRTKRIHRAARRNEQVMDTIDFDKLDESQRREAVTSCMVSSAVRIVTSTKSQKTLAVFADDRPVLPDEGTLMRLFVKK